MNDLGNIDEVSMTTGKTKLTGIKKGKKKKKKDDDFPEEVKINDSQFNAQDEPNGEAMKNNFDLENGQNDGDLSIGSDESEGEEEEEEDALIRLCNVHKTYLMGLEGVHALRGVDLEIKKGEFAIILGTSGGGKTTLLNLIGTIDKPTKGDLYLCGLRIKSNTDDKTLASIRLNKVAFVFQAFNLISSLSGIENVELPMQLRGTLSRSNIHKRAKELLEKVGLKDRTKHFPNMMSGGEQQRVTIARALSNRPAILLLDEPTGDLDTRNSDVVMKILMDLNMRDKITLVMVTHDVALKNYATKVIRMYDGKVHSIEKINEQDRKDHYDTLTKRVEAIEKGENIGALNVREGVEEQELVDGNEFE